MKRKYYLDPQTSAAAKQSMLSENFQLRDKIVILVAGAQYAKVIDRKVRELFVESDVMPLDTPAETIRANGYKGIVISGGPSSVYADDAPTYDADIFKLKIPLLGICYGMQIICKEFGGTVQQSNIREGSQQSIEIETSCPLFNCLNKTQSVLLPHGDSVEHVGDELKVGGWSSNRIVTAVYNEVLRIYGVQFHPEVELTINGKQMLSNFLYNICELVPNFTIGSRKDERVKYIKEKVGNNKVLLLVSGGVDSTVNAALLRYALHPSQIVALHIDNGFMRKNERENIEKFLQDMGIGLVVKKEFYAWTLAKVSTAAKKCIVTDECFLKATNDLMAKMELKSEEVLLVEVTLRSHLIESSLTTVNFNSERIIEPLIDFYKDEVRDLGNELGLPEELVERQPFPIAGAAMRILCAEEPYIGIDYSKTQVIARVIVDYKNRLATNHALINYITGAISECEQKELVRISANSKLQATILPIRSLGLKDEKSTDSYVVGLSSNSEPIWEDLIFLGKLIPLILRNVKRVCFVFGEALQHQIMDVTETTLNKYACQQLRQVDAIANKIIMDARLYRKFNQMPIVLIPVHFGRDPTEELPSCCRSVVIRPFITSDFMTGTPATPGTAQMPIEVLNNMVEEISRVDGISRVLYDLTAQPPSTIEWE